MASFEIILGEAADASARDTNGDEAALPSELLDVVVDGERVGAASEPVQAAYLLRELVSGALALLEGRGAKAHVPLTEPAWELCLVADGPRLLASLYRTGPLPEVRLLDRPIDACEIASQCAAALDALRPSLAQHFAQELGALIDRLATAAARPATSAPRGADARVTHRTPADESTPLRLSFDALVSAGAPDESAAVRADLHALLLRGSLALEARGRRVDFGVGFVFLQLERLLSLCRPLLEAHAARRALHLRVAAGTAMLGLRLSPEGRLALSVAHPDVAAFTTPALDVRDVVIPVADAALALSHAMVRADASRRRNIRLRALRTEARAVRRQLRLADRVANKLNPDPTPYRASAVSASLPPPEPRGGLDLGGSSRLRYTERWRAEIEGIDLAGTLLCGDRVIVTGVRETLAIDRRSGSVLWSRALPRAATAIAGGSILRLTARGEVELRDVADGETVWSSRIAPRVGAAGHAFAVTATGLPRVVLLAEGERRLVALDLATGEPRWRYQARNGGAFKLRRIGRLVLVASGDRSITALDVATGEVVWRCVGPAMFSLTPAVHRDTVLALAGSAGRGPARLCAIDAYTGALRWCAEHSASAVSLPAGAADVASVVVADREGARLVGHDLETGRERFCVPLLRGPVGARSVSLNAFDDLLVANAATGRVSAIDAADGRLRWSRVVAAPIADDAPRRMDVQLRAGALFVPQSQVAVLRPRDGAPVASIESCDLVPDLLRVDEQCALYVAEESGHLGCYELAARLSLVG